MGACAMNSQGLDDRGGVGAQGNDRQYTVITTLRDHTTPTLYWRTASNAIWKGLSLVSRAAGRLYTRNKVTLQSVI